MKATEFEPVEHIKQKANDTEVMTPFLPAVWVRSLYFSQAHPYIDH